MVLGDDVSTLETFVWILNHVSRSITWFLFALKAWNLVKWLILTWSFIWWDQFIDWLQFETRPSSPMNFGMAYWSVNCNYEAWIFKLWEGSLSKEVTFETTISRNLCLLTDQNNLFKDFGIGTRKPLHPSKILEYLRRSECLLRKYDSPEDLSELRSSRPTALFGWIGWAKHRITREMHLHETPQEKKHNITFRKLSISAKRMIVREFRWRGKCTLTTSWQQNI